MNWEVGRGNYELWIREKGEGSGELKSEKNPIGKSGSLSAVNAITIDDIPNDRFFNAK